MSHSLQINYKIMLKSSPWLLLPIQELFTINTIEFQSFTIYHLPSWKQIQKWVYFNILFVYVPLIVFLSICLYILGDLFKVSLHLSFCIALQDIYYMHLVWKGIENDLSRILDFLINLWDSFYKCFGHSFWQSTMEATNSVDEAKA